MAGGAFLAVGAGSSNSNQIGSDEIGTFFYAVGGVFLAASTVLWMLYFREREGAGDDCRFGAGQREGGRPGEVQVLTRKGRDQALKYKIY